MRSQHLYISLPTLFAALSLFDQALAHGGHHNMTQMALPDDAPNYRWPEHPAKWVLKVHFGLCLVSHLFILPAALVMEFARHRHHALAQLIGAMVGFVGMVFGWSNGNLNNIYGRFGWFMLCLLLAQTAMNLLLAMRVLTRNSKLEWQYRAIGVSQSIFTYMAMVLGVNTFLNLCSNTEHLGQCVSHFIRGSVLIMTGAFILVCMRVGGPLIVKFKRPVEFYESIVMMVVGLIGTFTEHNFFQQPKDGSDQWSHKDLQHTVIGVSWLAGGLLGVLMTWRSQPRERSAIPSIIFIATGISMIIHQQDLVMSSRVHFLFGASLVLLGLSTIVEITLIASNYVKEFGEPEFFQYVPLLFMTSSGMFLMGANRDMVLFLINSQLDIATYALLLLSFCFVILLYFYLLVDLYFTLGGTRVQQTAKYHQLTSNGEDDEHLPAGRRTRHSTSSQTSTLNHSENGDVPREELSPQSFAV